MFRKTGLYITLVFWSLNGFTQPYLSVREDFSVDQKRGCRDMFVTVTNIRPGDGVILFQYEGAGPGSPVTDSLNHTYSSSGSFWLYQYIQGGMAGTRADSILIEVLEPELVEFELLTCNNNDILVNILNRTYDFYEIDYGDNTIIQVPVNGIIPSHHYTTTGPFNVTVSGIYTTSINRCGSNTMSFTPVNTVLPATISTLETLDKASIIINYSLEPNTLSTLEVSLNGNPTYQTFKTLDLGTSIDTLTGLNLNNTYCFRIASNDACSNFKAYSDEVCSTFLTINSVSDAMHLNWQTQLTANFAATNILRNGSLLQSLTSTLQHYTDSTILCNTDYCFTIEIMSSGGSISRSQLLCETAFSTTKPAAVSNVSSSIEDNNVTWKWQMPPNERVGNFRITNEAGTVVGNTDQTSLVQELTEPIECLQWEFTNACGNTSDLTQVVCPIEVSYTAGSQGSVLLNWTSYVGWENGSSGYAVLIYDLNLNLVDSVWVGFSTSYEDPLPDDDNQVSHYRIVALPNDTGIINTESNLLTVEREPIISLPSSFTPNGDGLNDRFEIMGKYIMSQELTILNRWGAIVFSSETEGWDGTSFGKKVPMGTYVYQAKVKDFTGKEHIRTGTILILKD